MTSRTVRQQSTEYAPQTARAAQGRMIPTSPAVTGIVVRVAGTVPVCLDLTHVGTVEQQLGVSLGTVLVYLRTALTARTIAQGWGHAVVLARSLPPAIVGRRLVGCGPSTVAAMVQMAGMPKVRAEFEPARRDGAIPAVLRVQVGPVTWEVCDATAYASLLRAWREAARLLGDNLCVDE